jgi:hypothetical protein
MIFTKLIFWVFAFVYYQEHSNTGEIDLSYTITFFSNGKYLDAFNTTVNNININYGVFANFLKNPTVHILIQLPLSHDSCTTIEFNKDEFKEKKIK